MKCFKVKNEYGEFDIVQDPSFGYWRVDPIPSEEFLKDFYKNKFQNTSHSFHDNLTLDLIERKRPQLWEKRGKVLEIGCGKGDKLQCFKGNNFDVMGFEPGEEESKICRDKGLNVINSVFDREKAEEKGPFDIVILANVLEHVPHPEDFLRQVHSITQNDGILYVDVPNEFNKFQNVYIENTKEDHWFLAPPEHLNYFDSESLKNLLSHSQWDVFHQTTRFPMEMFLLMGMDYLNKEEEGSKAHSYRLQFEKSFFNDRENHLWDFYDSIAEAGLGRELIVLCNKENR